MRAGMAEARGVELEELLLGEPRVAEYLGRNLVSRPALLGARAHHGRSRHAASDPQSVVWLARAGAAHPAGRAAAPDGTVIRVLGLGIEP